MRSPVPYPLAEGGEFAGSRMPRVIGVLMLVEALTFVVASALHFDISVPLGVVTIHGEPFYGAAIPEAIIAGVLLAGTIGVFASPRGTWGLALGTTFFALAGVIIALSVILGGRVSRPGDLTYHSVILIALLVTIGLLLTRGARRAMRPR